MRPFLTFNSLDTRYPIILDGVSAIVTGSTPVMFEIVYGATFSAGPTWAGAAFSAYSGAEITTAAGTISTSPIVGEAFYVPASNQTKETISKQLHELYPLRLTAAGANYALGTVSIYATGLGSTSACRVLMHWREVR